MCFFVSVVFLEGMMCLKWCKISKIRLRENLSENNSKKNLFERCTSSIYKYKYSSSGSWRIFVRRSTEFDLCRELNKSHETRQRPWVWKTHDGVYSNYLAIKSIMNDVNNPIPNLEWTSFFCVPRLNSKDCFILIVSSKPLNELSESNKW